MPRKIYCLMQTQVVLTNTMSDELYETACLMYARGESRAHIVMEDMEGVVNTSGEKTALVWITGVKFTAEVETELGKGMVSFIIRTHDLSPNHTALGVRITDVPNPLGSTSIH